MNDDLNHPLSAPPGAVPEAESVTSEAGFCHLSETTVTSLKINENNVVSGDCHRSIYTHSEPVTSIKNEKPAKRKKRKDTVSDYERDVSDAQWKRDCLKLTATQLQALYPGTYQSFFAMKHVRSRPIEDGGEGAIINDDVATLAKFMRALGGPRRNVDMTVDRVDLYDPEYAAAKIVWHDKTAQARNRETNSIVTNPLTGEEATVAEVAERIGIKANTLTQALNRAIAKNPDREAEIRRTIAAKQRAKQLAKRPGQSASAASAPPEDIPPVIEPYQRRTQPNDWKARWPVEMPKDMRDQWEQKLKERRKVVNEETGELEWRYEFYIRTIRGVLYAGGFGGNMIGRAPSSSGTKLEEMRRAWADEDEPTDAEWSAYVAQESFYQKCVARLQEAMAVQPEFEAEARTRRRDRDRSYPRYGRNRPSRDYEDEAMKDDEAFGHIDADEPEGEAPPAADEGREEMARDYAAHRRRGMDL